MRILVFLAALAAASAAHAAPACVQDGDQVTAQGRLEIGRLAHPDDPQHRSESYLFITFEPALCLVSGSSPGGEPVARAEYLASRPPLKTEMGKLQTYSGNLERGSTGTDEQFSFVAY